MGLYIVLVDTGDRVVLMEGRYLGIELRSDSCYGIPFRS